MTVVEAVVRDLGLWEKRKAGISDSTEAATALALARELDSPTSATSKSMCAARLNETMQILRESLPPAVTADDVDELNERRRKRRAG